MVTKHGLLPKLKTEIDSIGEAWWTVADSAQPCVQQGPHVVLPQHVPPSFCQVDRYPHSLSECLDVVGHALPVFGAHVNLCVERAGHETFFGQLAQASVVGWAEVHALFGLSELTHDGREQQDTTHKRWQLGLSVQEQIAAKRVGDHPSVVTPKVVPQVNRHHCNLFVKGQGSKVTNRLAARYVEAALQQRTA